MSKRGLRASVFHCWGCGTLPDGDNQRRTTCAQVTLCQRCENQIQRVPIKLVKSETEKAHDKIYKEFLGGKRWPDIIAVHTASDGAVATARLKANTKFYSPS